MAILSPPARNTIPTWLDRYIFTEQIELRDIGDETTMFEVVGPQAASLATDLLGSDLASLQAH